MSKFFSTMTFAMLILAVALLNVNVVNAGAIMVPNHSFENPNLDGDASGEQYNYGIPDWQVTGSNWGAGVQDSKDSFYGSAHPLPSPFDGNQIGFVTGKENTVNTVDSASAIATLSAGEVYSLNIAVGNRSSDSLGSVDYEIGFITVEGIELGTFASTTVSPTGSIVDLAYMLDVDTNASDEIGEDVYVRIKCSVTDVGQANFDNVRLSVESAAVPEPSMFVLLGASLLGLLCFTGRGKNN